MTRIFRRFLLAAALAPALAAAPAHALEIGPDPHSPNADDIAVAYWVMMGLAVLLVLAINAALVMALMRFRERRGTEPARLGAGRGFVRRAALPLSLLALALFVFGVLMTRETRTVEPSGSSGLQAAAARTAQVGVQGLPSSATSSAAASAADESAQGEPTASDPLPITAVAQQWLWRFEYPEQTEGSFSEGIATIFSYGELVVPVDTVVNLNIDSTDVVHSWFVPALGPQVWAVPGEVQETSFVADEEGVYRGYSTVFSGAAGYPVMRSTVRVVSAQEYEDYVEELNTELRKGQEAVSNAAETDLAQEDSDETSESEAADAETGPDLTGTEDGE